MPSFTFIQHILRLEELPDDHEFTRAIWEGDTEWLDEHYGCGCCCHEHTHSGCLARLWGACRGQGAMTREDHESWARHYERFHGMTPEQFFT